MRTREANVAGMWCAGSASCRRQSPLRNWIAGSIGATTVLFAPNERWSDPAARVTQRIVGSLEDLLGTGSRHDESSPMNSDWLDRWSHADSAVARALAEPLMDAGLSEPATVTALAQFPAAEHDAVRRLRCRSATSRSSSRP